MFVYLFVFVLWCGFVLLLGFFFPNQLTIYGAKFVGIYLLVARPIFSEETLLNSLKIKNTGWLHSIWVFAGSQTNWKMSLIQAKFQMTRRTCL